MKSRTNNQARLLINQASQEKRADSADFRKAKDFGNESITSPRTLMPDEDFFEVFTEIRLP